MTATHMVSKSLISLHRRKVEHESKGHSSLPEEVSRRSRLLTKDSRTYLEYSVKLDVFNFMANLGKHQEQQSQMGSHIKVGDLYLKVE
jgi:hypothetical protein